MLDFLSKECNAYKSIKDIIVLEKEEQKVIVVLINREDHKELKKIRNQIEKDDYSCTILTKKEYDFDCIFYGYSLFSGKRVFEMFNIKPSLLIYYDLKKLNHTEKTMFGYALRGRSQNNGILYEINGIAVGRNCIVIPYDQFKNIKDLFSYWKIDFKIKTLLCPLVDNQLKNKNNNQ